MATKTNIEWTDFNWNPLSGCSRKSHGCEHCYAETMTKRLAAMGQEKYGGLLNEHGRFNGVIKFSESDLVAPLRWKGPRKVFVNSMSDLFHENVKDEWIDQMFAVMALTPQHTYQILTKRPERMKAYLSNPETPFRIAKAIDAHSSTLNAEPLQTKPIEGYPGYWVTSSGDILSEKRGRMITLKPDTGEQGHSRVHLFREGQTNKRGDRHLIHRLVLEAFVGPPPAPDSQGRHRDGNPKNNALSNLLWGDQSANWDDRKRHGNFRSYSKLNHTDVKVIRGSGKSAIELAAIFKVSSAQIQNIRAGKQWAVDAPIEWPLPNCWLGVSVEDQKTADERIPLLLDTPAAVRWISAEPLLGPIDLTHYLYNRYLHGGPYHEYNNLDWVVVGGESGPGARGCNLWWMQQIVAQCKAANVPVFVKQVGANPFLNRSASVHEERPGMSLHIETMEIDMTLHMKSRKGGDPAEWPEDLRVREYPKIQGVEISTQGA